MFSFGVPVTVQNLIETFPKLSKKVAKILVKLNIEDPEEYLELVNELVGGFGVESVEVGDHRLLYVNTGDSYDSTLTYDESEWAYRIGSWGDWVELREEQLAEEQ